MCRLIQRYPLLTPCVGLILGILLAGTWPLGLGIFWALAGCLGLSLLWPKWGIPGRAILLLGFFVCVGVLRIGDHFFAPLPAPLSQWVESGAEQNLVIRAQEYCQTRGNRSRFDGQVLGYYEDQVFHPLSFKLRVSLGGQKCSAVPGQVFRTLAKLRAPRRFQNPSSFDYPRYLRTQNILATAWVKSEEWFVPLGSNNLSWASQVRRKLLKGLEEAVPNSKVRGIFETLLLREKRFLDPQVEDGFRRAGVAHLLVVSGLHLGLVYSFFYFPCYLLLSCYRPWSNSGRARSFALGLALLPTFFYAMVVGFSPSVLRALGIALLTGLVLISRFRKNFFALLLLVGFLLLLWNPLFLFDLSFQLSFLSVASLGFFGKRFLQLLKRGEERFPFLKQRWFRWTSTLLVSSLVVNIVLYPLVAHSFHEVSLIAPLSNLFFIPYVTLFLLPALLVASLIYLVFPGAGAMLFQWLTGAGLGLLEVLAGLTKIPFASRLVAPFSPWDWVAYGLVLLSLFFLHRPRIFLSGMLSVGFVLSLSFGFSHWLPKSTPLQLTLLDVGQGESMILQLPNGEAIVIDGGGFPYSNFDVGKNVVLPELLRRNISSLRAVVMTHADVDHSKGLRTLVELFPVQEFWLSTPKQLEEVQPLLRELQAKGVSIRPLEKGSIWQEAGVQFEVLWPLKKKQFVYSDNNQSLVLKVCYQKICFLLTGDIEAEVERALVEEGMDLGSTVLKVAHHGSSTSSSPTFLKKVNPRMALISAGRKNRFGFPHPRVLERFQRDGVKVLRTDQQGQVTVWTDGITIGIE